MDLPSFASRKRVQFTSTGRKRDVAASTGRVFAAFLAKMNQTFLSGRHEASIGDDSVRTISLEQTELVLAEVRQREMARAVGRPIPGVNAFSVPVFDQFGIPLGSVARDRPFGVPVRTVKKRCKISRGHNRDPPSEAMNALHGPTSMHPRRGASLVDHFEKSRFRVPVPIGTQE
jgi:hypothetical protein